MRDMQEGLKQLADLSMTSMVDTARKDHWLPATMRGACGTVSRAPCVWIQEPSNDSSPQCGRLTISSRRMTLMASRK